MANWAGSHWPLLSCWIGNTPLFHTKRLTEVVRDGKVELLGFDITYNQPVDIDALETRDFGLPPEAYWPLRVGQATKGESVQWEQFDESLLREGSLLTTLQAVNSLLEVVSFSSGNSTQLLVGIPIYATIRNYSLFPAGLEVEVEFQSDVTGVTLSAYTTAGDGESLRGITSFELTREESADAGDGLRRIKRTVQLETHGHDRLNLRLIHKPTAHQIESRHERARYFLDRPNREGDPLVTIFSAFCDYDLLERYLTQPTPELARNASIAGGFQSLFEWATAWFVTLLGFRAVKLAGTIHEKFKQDQAIGSDVVGFLEQRKVVALCACTVSDPKDADFDILGRCRDGVADLLGDHALVIRLVVFTSRKVPAAKDRGRKFGVTVIDPDDLHSGITLLKRGDATGALGKLLDIWP